MEQVRIVETGNYFGNMNSNAKFFSEGLTREEINQRFLQNRMRAGNYYGFDGHKVFMADQVTKERGTVFELTEEYVEANPKG